MIDVTECGGKLGLFICKCLKTMYFLHIDGYFQIEFFVFGPFLCFPLMAFYSSIMRHMRAYIVINFPLSVFELKLPCGFSKGNGNMNILLCRHFLLSLESCIFCFWPDISFFFY